MKMEQIIEKIKIWGRDKGISNPDKQMLHCYEECAEAARYIIREDWNMDEIKAEIGDIGVTLVILADILGLDFQECLEIAHRKNEKRVGKNISGNFVKSEDLQNGDK